MTLAIQHDAITIEQFMARPDTRDFELVDGELVERKKVGARSSFIVTRITIALGTFDPDFKLGWTFDSETVYRCFGRGQSGKRLDFSFIRRGRLPGDVIPDAYIPIAPDLAVEVVSPNDLAYDVNEKVELYLSAGVSVVWVVYPESRTIELIRQDRTAVLLGGDQEISGESVLPGFRERISRFFPPAENVETRPQPVE